MVSSQARLVVTMLDRIVQREYCRMMGLFCMRNQIRKWPGMSDSAVKDNGKGIILMGVQWVLFLVECKDSYDNLSEHLEVRAQARSII